MMIRVFGVPAAKGSMKCIGATGGRHHQLVEQNAKKIDPWRKLIANAGQRAAMKYGRLTGPVAIEVTFTVPRPASVPLSKRAWPITRSSGDLDKQVRLCLDALTGTLIADDSQVVYLTAAKTYPDTPGATDRLDRPGAIIRIEEIQ